MILLWTVVLRAIGVLLVLGAITLISSGNVGLILLGVAAGFLALLFLLAEVRYNG
jgi:hypothetical protein